MKKFLQITHRSVLLIIMLFSYNNSVLALPTIGDPFDKIPISSPSPSLAEVLLPPVFIPVAPSCNKTFPEPELFFTGKTEKTVRGVEYISYSLDINNKEEYPDYLFAGSPNLPPCGLNNNSSRTWVQIYEDDDETDNYLYGFCALSSGNQLDKLWFAHKKTDPAPSLVNVVLKDRLCNKEYKSASIALNELTVDTGAPVIAGIGLVPRTFINQSNGLATTGEDHPINVVDAPFGKNMRFIGNIGRLRDLGITRYAIGYCDMASHDCNAVFTTGFNVDDWKFVEDVRTNYFWSTILNKYVLDRESPVEIFNNGTSIYKTYSVPSSSQTWYFENLLFDWITHGTVKVPSSRYKVHLFGFNGDNISNLVNLSPAESTMVVRIDNTPPIMSINSIEYNGIEVNSCSIVTLDNASDSIKFDITATDPDGYLWKYALSGEYGDNKTLDCAAEEYNAGSDSSPIWKGASPSTTKNCENFPKSCAYSFHISGWDRAINGYTRIHYVDYFKTLTVQVPPPL